MLSDVYHQALFARRAVLAMLTFKRFLFDVYCFDVALEGEFPRCGVSACGAFKGFLSYVDLSMFFKFRFVCRKEIAHVTLHFSCTVALFERVVVFFEHFFFVTPQRLFILAAVVTDVFITWLQTVTRFHSVDCHSALLYLTCDMLRMLN